MNDFLTVCITTYNRRERLLNVLKKLESQMNQEFYVVIINNASNYSIEELLSGLNNSFTNKITVINRVRNIGMKANIATVFDYCKTKWLWHLSDDDDIDCDAVDRIYRQISEDSDVGIIDFTIARFPSKDETFFIEDFDDFIKLYYAHYKWYRGEIIWISNKIYNTELLSVDVLSYVYNFAYSGIYAALVFTKTIEKGIRIKIIQSPIVSYYIGEVSWNMKDVALGTRTLPDFFYYLPRTKLKKLLRILSLDFVMIVNSYYQHEKTNRPNLYFDELYYGLYKYMWNFPKRLVFMLFIIMTKFTVGNFVLRFIYLRIVSIFQSCMVKLWKVKQNLLRRKY